MANCLIFDRKYIAFEVLSNCEFLSNQMFDRKNIALCLTEPLCQTEISTDVLSNQRFDRTSQKCQKYKYFTQNTPTYPPHDLEVDNLGHLTFQAALTTPITPVLTPFLAGNQLYDS